MSWEQVHSGPKTIWSETMLTPFWIGLLKRAMPVVIDAGTTLYKQRAAAKQSHHSEPGSLDAHTERLDALQTAVIRVATEMESLDRKQVQLTRAVSRLRWAVVGALILSALAIVLVFSA